MRAKRQTEAGRAVYARRKCITEPVHGLIKQARGFRQFLLRSLTKVRAEFTLVALTHTLLKLWRTALRRRTAVTGVVADPLTTVLSTTATRAIA